MNKTDLIVEMKGITKYFGGLRALDKVDLELYKGEIVAIAGDNGAGKSTLIKVLSGVYQPDEGKIWLDVKQVTFLNRQHAKNLGIEAVYQDLALIETLSAPANVFLGSEIYNKIFGVPILDNRLMEKDAINLIKDKLGIQLDKPRQQVYSLSGGQKQAIAISRALRKENTKVLILDEPVAALGPEETEKTLKLITTLKKQGLPVVLISHNLEHIFSVADRIVVLRLGKMVGTRIVKKTTKNEILGLIIGA